jgi:hypothetical protein
MVLWTLVRELGLARPWPLLYFINFIAYLNWIAISGPNALAIPDILLNGHMHICAALKDFLRGKEAIGDLYC